MVETCPRFQEIAPIVYLSEQISTYFVTKEIQAHARECSQCMFWLTYSIALNEVYFVTPRIKIAHACVEREHIRFIFATSVLNIMDVLVTKSPEFIKESIQIDLELNPWEYAAWNHCKKCELCMDYFNQLLGTMLVTQIGFENAIRSGKLLRIQTKFAPSGKEIVSNAAEYFPNRSKRPN